MTGADGWNLSQSTVGAYLRERGIAPEDADIQSRSLGGGVSNRVIQARWDRSGCLVVKQPLPNLAVTDDWPADVTRVHNEAAAARAYHSIIAAAALPARVPEVVFESKDDHILALGCAPEHAIMWKRELLEGRVDVRVARMLGHVLGEVQARASKDRDLRSRFANKQPFVELRLDPYHRHTADRHPDIGDAILAEIDRIEAVELTIVHGDFSPKNVLVDRSNGNTPWILDFEVAHWGDPVFDAAFMLNHLLIKSVYRSAARREYLHAAKTFWDAYRARTPWEREVHCVAELGVLMLARVDGKSPVEYLEDDRTAATLRSIAKRALRDGCETIEAYIDIIVEETGGR